MAEHLWPLVRLEAATEEELIEAYRKLYLETYVKSGVEYFDWNGNRVYFSARIFDHAFSEGSDYRFNPGVHDLPFSKRRARCILCIKEVLAASKGTIEVLQQFRKDSRNRMKKRRVLIVVEEKYVVVLDVRDNHREYDFISAFLADEGYLKKLRKGALLLETKKSPSLNGD